MARQITIQRGETYSRHLLVTVPEPKEPIKRPIEMTLLVNYTGPSDTYKAVSLDNDVLPLLVAAPDLLAALRGLLTEAEAMNTELRAIGKGRDDDCAHPDCPIDIAHVAVVKATS